MVANACGDDSTCKAKGTATVLLGNGQGAFQPGTEISLGMSPSSVALGDLAGRKVLDLAVAYAETTGCRCWRAMATEPSRRPLPTRRNRAISRCRRRLQRRHQSRRRRGELQGLDG